MNGFLHRFLFVMFPFALSMIKFEGGRGKWIVYLANIEHDDVISGYFADNVIYGGSLSVLNISRTFEGLQCVCCLSSSRFQQIRPSPRLSCLTFARFFSPGSSCVCLKILIFHSILHCDKQKSG